MPQLIKLRVQRYSLWTSTGSRWHWLPRIGGPILALLIVNGAASGCSNNQSSDDLPSDQGANDVPATEQAAATERPTATVSPAETPRAPTQAPTPALSSNQAEIGDLLLTVNELRSFVPQFSNEPGFTWYAVDVTGKNTGDKNYALNAINFQLKDSENYVTTIGLAVGGPEPMLTHSDIPPRQEVRGWVLFKVGAGRTPVELLYRSFTGTTGSIPVSAAGVSTAPPSPTSAPAGLSPEETVALHYTLIDRRQFSSAYALYSSRFRASEGSFEAWQAGYATTESVTVEFVRRASGAGTVVEVSILARDIVDGRPLIRRFAGTWTLVQEQGAWRLDTARIQVLPAP
jgi:Domain of unknown function (DUF4352)